MRRKRAHRWSLRLGTLAILLAALWIWLRGPASSETFELASGARFSIQSTSYGTNHYGPPRFWNQMVRALPGAWRSRLRLGPVKFYRTAEPSLILWTQTDYQGISRSQRQLMSEEAHLECYLIDESGFAAPAHLSILAGGFESLAADSPEWDAWGVDAFPRRASEIRLAVIERGRDDAARLVGMFRRRNPVGAAFPYWDPEPLPARRQLGDWRCDLVSLRVTPEASGEITSGLAEAHFRVSSQGAPSMDWQVEQVELTDATGNRILIREEDEESLLVAVREGELETCRFIWPLWRRESAWGLTVEFIPRPDARLAPAEVIQLRGLPVPGPEGTTWVNRVFSIGGTSLKVMGLVGEHAHLPGRERDVQGQVRLEVEVSSLPKDHRFVVLDVIEADGRKARRGMEVEHETYGFEFLPETVEVDVRLAVFQRRVASFKVKPVFEQ